MNRLFRVLRWIILLARTERADVPRYERCLRGIWMVPWFGLLLVVLRVRFLCFGPLIVNATTRHDLIMRCRLPDLIPLYIAIFGTWEPDVCAIIGRNLKPGDIFVDVGANIGFHSLFAARLVGKTGVVVALEPDPVIRSNLEENMELNPVGEVVRVESTAAWHERAELHMNLEFTHNLGRSQTRAAGDGPTVSAAPLSELLKATEITSARIIKIDVEGAEPAVLQGMSVMFDRLRSDAIILVELSPQWWEDQSLKLEDVLEPLLQSGFKPFSHANSYWPWRYLWPNCVVQPRRVSEMHGKPRRIDLLLARGEAT